MRARLFLAIAAGALGLAFSQPAAAGGWNDGYGCCAGTVYVHHHVYAPVRYRHIYHRHVPGPRHINVVRLSGLRLLRPQVLRLELRLSRLFRGSLLPLAVARRPSPLVRRRRAGGDRLAGSAAPR